MTELVSRRFERQTRQRRAIVDALERANRPLSIEELHQSVQSDAAGVSLATVYRSLRPLLDEGWLTQVTLPRGAPCYEVAGKAHHHHFSCLSCRRVYELAGCTGTPALDLPNGFEISSHDVVVFGRCANCVQQSRHGADSLELNGAYR